MKHAPFSILASVLAIGCGAAVGSPPSGRTVEGAQQQAREEQKAEAVRLVEVLAAKTVSVEEVEEAEDRLAELPAEFVVAALFPKISLGMPPGPIYNGGSRELEHSFPPPWRAHYSYY